MQKRSIMLSFHQLICLCIKLLASFKAFFAEEKKKHIWQLVKKLIRILRKQTNSKQCESGITENQNIGKNRSSR